MIRVKIPKHIIDCVSTYDNYDHVEIRVDEQGNLLNFGVEGALALICSNKENENE